MLEAYDACLDSCPAGSLAPASRPRERNQEEQRCVLRRLHITTTYDEVGMRKDLTRTRGRHGLLSSQNPVVIVNSQFEPGKHRMSKHHTNRALPGDASDRKCSGRLASTGRRSRVVQRRLEVEEIPCGGNYYVEHETNGRKVFESASRRRHPLGARHELMDGSLTSRYVPGASTAGFAQVIVIAEARLYRECSSRETLSGS